MSKMSQDNYLRRNQGGGLPPISGKSLGGVNGSKYYGPSSSSVNNSYNYNAYRPSKLRSLNSKHPNQISHGGLVAGERIKLNQHASQEKVSNYSGNYGSPNREYLAEISEVVPPLRGG